MGTLVKFASLIEVIESIVIKSDRTSYAGAAFQYDLMLAKTGLDRANFTPGPANKTNS